MGCTTEKTISTTTVTGHPDKLVGVDVDMGDMTDAFMTACVVAAVSKGTTRITNIDNQRVKECDRIAAMVTELGKIGIKAWELPDGIAVEGNPDLEIPSPVVIHCYHDHRIAMSFGVLASRCKNIIMEDKQCVDKTYPEFWDTLSQYGLNLDPEVAEKVSSHDGSGQQVVLIGMRGAGKTTLGRELANRLAMPFHDVDDVITEKLKAEGKGTIKDLVKNEGWAAFRKLEAKVTSSLIHSSGNSVVSCGGGVVEIPEMRKLLASHPHVVFINKPIEDILSFLSASELRPDYDAETQQVYARRLPWYRSSSSIEFPITKGNGNFTQITEAFCKQLKFALGVEDFPRYATLGSGEESFFVSLTFPDVTTCLEDLNEITSGVDVIEIRVDLLQSQDLQFVSEQVALIRTVSPMPILFAVRTMAHGGKFAGSEDEYFELVELGIKLGCELVDIEIDKDAKRSRKLMERSLSKIVASVHTPGSNGGSVIALQTKIYKALQLGPVAVVKIVTDTKKFEDVDMLERAVKTAQIPNNVGVVALAMGARGKLTRIVNKCMTPVTHPRMNLAAAVGQMSVKEMQDVRALLGIHLPHHYCIFGNPVKYSPSPTIYNTVFEKLYLPRKYGKIETDDVEEVRKVLADPDFYGASVTIPLKEKLIPLMDEQSEHVRAIGALNFIMRTPEGKFRCDNTDWVAIYTLIKEKLRTREPSVLIMGAGGTSRAAIYAMKKVSNNVSIYNRTFQRAQGLAEQFSVTAIPNLTSPETPYDVIISCVPGKAEMTVPDDHLDENTIVFDVSYLPRDTALTLQAEKRGCRSIIRGIDMLISQGLPQAEMFVGRPRETFERDVEKATRDFYTKFISTL